jgi:shikimate dehydrogenase
MADRFIFFGVSTGASSIMRVFPVWAEILGLGAEIVGYDIPIGTNAEAYRRAVLAIRGDDSIRGALITSHKVAFYTYAGDLFDVLDEPCQSWEEISCIYKRGGKLCGSAKDPGVAAHVLQELAPPEHWRARGADALCLGAGGSGTAISAALLQSVSPPRWVTMADVDPSRLEHLRALHERAGIDGHVAYEVVREPGDCDRLIDSLPAASLVVNATGVGKDSPGSPISEAATFPQGGIVWELNYRGELGFLQRAEQQRALRELRVENGWQYFIRAWVAVIEEVFARGISEAELEPLADVAGRFQPPTTRGPVASEQTAVR